MVTSSVAAPVDTNLSDATAYADKHIDLFQIFVSANTTRNSSGDEIANVNFLYDDIVHAVKYNRLLHKFSHRSFSATQVYQIQRNNAM